MVQSLYSTYIKSGGAEKFRFPENINDPMLNYQLLLDRWAEVFGWRQLLVRSYDDVMNDRGDVVRDFLLTAGLSQTVGSAQTGDDKPNRSLSKGSLEFLRLFNKHVPYLKDGVLNQNRADIVRRLELISKRNEEPHDEPGAQDLLKGSGKQMSMLPGSISLGTIGNCSRNMMRTRQGKFLIFRLRKPWLLRPICGWKVINRIELLVLGSAFPSFSDDAKSLGKHAIFA